MTMLYPSERLAIRPDATTYAGCPGPPPATGAVAGYAGLGVSVRGAGGYTVYASRFGRDRAVDVFDVYTSGATPAAAWVGCVRPPDAVSVNDLAPLPGGGFVSTNWSATVPGEVWEWLPARGWAVLPGTEGIDGPNGIQVSADGRTVYFAGWGARRMYKVTRGTAPPRLDSVPVDFHPDNINFAADGTLLVAGQSCRLADCQGRPDRFHVARIDPATLIVTPIVEQVSTPAFGAATTALQIGDGIWVGSFRSNRIAIFPVSPVRQP
ncbi:MAG: SMP-30/gluconolactonase/LRE family protein [Acidobacteria bacterium]|nr:SMP-30/gluconolactonase/LRE family protein [Acidobacteriota bacterium]